MLHISLPRILSISFHRKINFQFLHKAIVHIIVKVHTQLNFFRDVDLVFKIPIGLYLNTQSLYHTVYTIQGKFSVTINRNMCIVHIA